MKITHNADMMHKFSKIMLSGQIKQSKQRSGFHRSDAIACPLKCYWRMMGKEAIYTSQNIGIFLIGAIAHVTLHQYFDAQEKIFYLNEAEEDVAVTIDALHGEYPIESKTTRRKIYSKSDIPNDWVEQLCIGMSTMGKNVGYLMILNVISFAVMVWEFELTDKDLAMFKAVFAAKIKQIAEAIRDKDPTKLEPKRKDCEWCAYKPYRGKRKDWKGCPYYNPLPKPKRTKKT